MKTFEYIKNNEGFSAHPYRCPAGKLTIGYGRNIEENGISKSEAEFLLNNDISGCVLDLISLGLLKGQNFISPRDTVLIDMLYNLGLTKFLMFKKMIQAVRNNDWERAADEIMNSRYASQVGLRAVRNEVMMRTGIFPKENK